jgi:hypothetical protein
MSHHLWPHEVLPLSCHNKMSQQLVFQRPVSLEQFLSLNFKGALARQRTCPQGLDFYETSSIDM